MMSCYMEQEGYMLDFVKERDKAFVAAVLIDDWEPAKRYCKKYDIPIPEKEIVMKAGIYKAVQECTNIPDDIKNEAAVKCVKLGFSPDINPVTWSRRER